MTIAMALGTRTLFPFSFLYLGHEDSLINVASLGFAYDNQSNFCFLLSPLWLEMG